jgi:chromosome segregation ATPase
MKRFMLAVAMAAAFAAPMPSRAAEAAKPVESKGEYTKKAHAAIDELSEKIDALEVKAKKAGAEAKEGLNEKLDALKGQRKTARKDLAKLKRTSGKAWTKLKAGIDKGIAEMKEELAKD